MSEIPVLHDIGESREVMSECAPCQTEEAPSKYYPNIYSINTKQLPELDIYDAGDDVILIVKAHVKRKEEISHEDEEKRTEYGLELREATVMDVGEFKTMRETGMTKEQVRKAKDEG